MADTITIREHFEAPSAEYPEGSYFFRVGSKFIKATGRFAEILCEPDEYNWLRLATMHRCVFFPVSAQPPLGIFLGLPCSCLALVKEGPKAMVLYGH